jgi:hypothetical protein
VSVFDSTMMKRLFKALNDELEKKGVIGEIGICGGAVMCLVFKARRATKDVDAVFQPTKEIRDAAKKVAGAFGLDEHWLNDAVKGFLHAEPPRVDVLELSHLRVWAPAADYMLAMKCVSARFDTYDRDDVLFLIRHLGFDKPEQVFEVISRYYPRGRIPAKAQYLVEELMEDVPVSPKVRTERRR